VTPWLAAALALAAAIGAHAAHAAIQPAALRAIAIAEDERRWADGELAGFLRDPDAETRARACLATGRIQDSAAVESLIPLLGDASHHVRREAVFALGQIGHRSAVASLEGQLGSPDVETIELSLEALGKIGERATTQRVAEFLRNESSRLRAAAAVALWRLGDSTAVDRLIERHDDPDEAVRWRVMYALEKVVDPTRLVLVAALHQDDDNWLVRAYSARTLGRQGSTRGTSYLLQMFSDHVPGVAVNAMRALRQIADSTCTFCAPALTTALSHGHPYVRSVAAQVLGDRFALAAADSAARSAALDSLAARLADGDAATRASAADALMRIRGKAAWGTVQPLLQDSSVYVRTALLTTIGRVEERWAEDLLLEKLSVKAPLFERMTAALALGARKGNRLAPILRTELYDRDLLMVAASAGALEQMGDTASVPSLVRVYERRAHDGDADARIAIRDALRTLAGRAFTDSLERAHAPASPSPSSYPADYGRRPAVRGAVLHTAKGDIEWAFRGNEAPQTVANFVRLARAGYFDGLAFHRVVPNFVIQDGDPTGTGWGGPGYTIRCEYNRLRYDHGMVGMALSGKDTGGSQWFITHSPQPHLDGRYTIFAQVVRGMEVVNAAVQGDRILKVDILE
jgi:cyclophilin family peptidyl-prolyl cis-trans isomerase/HEAT repeat protein